MDTSAACGCGAQRAPFIPALTGFQSGGCCSKRGGRWPNSTFMRPADVPGPLAAFVSNCSVSLKRLYVTCDGVDFQEARTLTTGHGIIAVAAAFRRGREYW